MSVVYRARDERLQRDVAVKVLNIKTRADRSASRRFHREALILGRLNHPNVEAVYDFHSENGLEYLVIEYVAGQSLDSRLRNGALLEKDVIALGVQLAGGLAAAHTHGIIHRDLKPGNLRVTPENILKILDFGLAQLFASPDAETLTHATTVAMKTEDFAGTLAYMAPEQLEGHEPDTRSDIYSAGVVLYELATGTRPFPQRGQMLWDAILQSLPPEPRIKKPDISPELEFVILKCLKRKPTQRFQSAEELLTDLSHIGAADGMASTRELQLERVTGRKQWAITVSVAIVLVGITVGMLMRTRSLKQQAQPTIMAVLPIDTVGQDLDTGALGLGLTETVTAKLVEASNMDAIQVVSPRDLRDKGVKTADDARREFGTNLVVESSLQRSGQIIRINCYLVDSKTHGELAAKSIEAEATDPFGLQDKVVSAVLDMLPVQTKPEQRRNLDVREDTQPAAYEAYIRGRGYLQEYQKPESIDSAITEFNQAVRVDAKYAPAYAGLGEAYWMGFQQPMNRGKGWLANASQNCQKALALSPQFAEGYTCLGNVLFGTGKYEEAVKHYQRALQLDPNSDYALGQLADAYQSLGNSAAAENAYKNAISLRPSYWGVYSGLGVFYFTQARYSEASAMFSKVIELAPNNYHGYSNLAAAYLYMGRYTDSIAASERSIELRPNRDAYANLAAVYFSERRFPEAAEYSKLSLKLDPSDALNWGVLGDALYWTPGRRGEAADAYHKAIALFNSKIEVNSRDAETLGFVAVYSAMVDDKKAAMNNLGRALAVAPNDADVLFKAAFVYSHLGDTDQALTWLQKALNAGYPTSAVRDTPEFDRFLTDPRFKRLVGGN